MVKKVSLLIIMALALLPTLVFAQSVTPPVSTPEATPSPDELKIEGVVESLQNNVLSIGGQQIDVSQSQFERTPVIGGTAEAFVTSTTNSAWVASLVEFDRQPDEDLNKVEIKGIATQVSADFVVIGGRTFDISNAEVGANVVAGAFVNLELEYINGAWVAFQINLDDPADFRDDRDDDNRDGSSNDNDDNSGPGNGGNDDHDNNDDRGGEDDRGNNSGSGGGGDHGGGGHD